MQNQPTGVARIGGRAFASGLFWQSAPNTSFAQKKAIELSREPGIDADLFCLRKSDPVQFGLCRGQNGITSGMPSIATLLATAIPGTWIGVFRADEGWIYVSVRKDAIMPDGDAFFIDEESAHTRLLNDLSLGGWDKVFAPAAWGIADAHEGKLIDLVAGLKGVPLRPTKASPLQMLFSAGILGGSLFLAWWLFIRVPAPESEPSQPALGPLGESAQMMGGLAGGGIDLQGAGIITQTPWTSFVRSSDFLSMCAEATSRVQVLPGFTLEGITCGPGTATVSYVRSFGRMAWLDNLDIQGTVARPDSGKVAVALAYAAKPANMTTAETPVRSAEAKLLLADIAQAYPVLSFNFKEMPPPPPEIGSDGKTQIVQQFSTIEFTSTSLVPAIEMGSLLAQIPASIIDSVQFTPGSGQWVVKGKIYVPPRWTPAIRPKSPRRHRLPCPIAFRSATTC